MPHLALLGDSIFDNAPYTDGGPAVIDHMHEVMPPGWKADLLAVDGAVAEDVPQQLQGVTAAHTHLVLSIGGNNALQHFDVLDMRVRNSREVLLALATASETFDIEYRHAVRKALAMGRPLVVCTIYEGNFPDRSEQRAARIALMTFNDVILRVASENDLRVIDLRCICKAPEDYANPIEPSVIGGSKIAKAIVRAVSEGRFSGKGAQISC